MLDIQNYTLRVAGKPILQNISLSIAPGEIYGLVGKSGSGKSTLGLEIAGLFTAKAEREGVILFEGTSSIVFQEAQSALNPLMTIGKQVQEAVNDDMTAAELLKSVGLEHVKLNAYPHELSGGMRQRVLIAMAIAKNPKLLILDEPTSSLDSKLKRQILDLLRGLNRERGMSMLLISHDRAEVASLCSRVGVLDQGRFIDEAEGESLGAFSTCECGPTLLQIEQMAVKNRLAPVSLQIHEREILGIMGGSGSGKSTLAKAIVGLVKPTSGGVELLRECVIQIIFQDPYAALNPKMTVREAIKEPAEIHRKTADVDVLLEKVLLPKHYAERFTTELSGGERQRVAIARALALKPRLLIMDESLASLDRKTQNEIIKVMMELRDSGISIMFISHDRELVEKVCTRVVKL